MERRKDDGAVALEFGLLLLPLILILFGIIQFGLTFHRTQALQAAGHEGARIAALPSTSVGDIVGRVQDHLLPIALLEDWTACPADEGEICWQVSDQAGNEYSDVAVAPCAATTVDVVTVSVQQPYTISMPFMDLGPYTLAGTGEFRCER